jgi:UDP-arabinose 4-epimerase
MTTILVTGGAGYVGAHTCKALAAAGYKPVAYDNLVYGHERAVKWGPLERGDILDAARLSQVVEAYRPWAVVHFAAFCYVGESVTDPAKYYRNNFAGTLSLLGVMRAHDIGNVVFSSSCATYGTPEKVPITEDAPQNPINAYGASKLMVERVLKDYRAAYGLKSVALRYFNAAGADPEGEIGEDHDPETHLIPLVLDAALGVRPHITLFGDDYGTPDGTCIRDYIHVSDIADAHVLALSRLKTGSLDAAYNLGTGTGVSVAQIIAAARKITKRDIRIVKGARRAGDPAVLVADPRRVRQDLKWTPRYPAIDPIIESAWNWNLRLRKSGERHAAKT